MKHGIRAGIFVLLITAAMLYFVQAVHWMPIEASREAKQIDWLFGLHMDVIAVLYALVNGILIYSIIAFRRKKGEEQEEGAYFHSNTKLEILWTAIPLIVVMFFAYLGMGVLSDISAASQDELVVNVTARQWSWRFDYPESGVKSNELYLPANRKVRLVMTSEDVIHSFWVPEFRLKKDTVPGITTEVRLTPSKKGSYKVRCAELCGTSHTAMLGTVRVVSPEEFATWQQQKLAPATRPEDLSEEELITLGQRTAEAAGCKACHSTDGSKSVGPTWQGLYDSQRTFSDGSSVTADEAYLRQSILHPDAKVVEGYPNIMPKNYGETLTDLDLAALIAYIRSLK